MCTLWDYHIHSKLCRHADGSIEEYVKSAITKGLNEIGISEHIPYEYLPDCPLVPREEYGMPKEELSYYFEELYRLREVYSDKIHLKFGMEIDYFPWSQTEILKFIQSIESKVDYIIGSVHMINSQGIGIWPVDDHRTMQYEKFGIDESYNLYLESLEALILSGSYDILAHLDLPKKHGARPSDHDLYLRRIDKILDILKESGMTVEISTAGLRKQINEIYPEPAIVDLIVQKGIPVVISSDAHNPNEIGYEFESTFKVLKNKGLKYLSKYSSREQHLIPIDKISL